MKPFRQGKYIYDLSHLHPFPLEIIQPAQGANPHRTYRFEVLFSLHCFTQGIKADSDPNLNYSDNRELRTFCFERYQLSLKLPNIIREIHTKFCRHTGKGNFFIIELLTDEGAPVEYEIYFDIKRSHRANKQLQLYIQSAYVRDSASRAYRHSAKKISFFVIAHNRSIGKPIKTPT